ncbi:MAG: hypothetical protein KDB14_31795 [Planctomycetales bacterium]|nr:hypothetical protein [Planctomycetales bacterium]
MPRKSIVSLATFCLLLTAEMARGEWPHWRGPNRDDVVTESSGWNGEAWLNKLPAWRINAGEGSTSPIVFKDRLYVMGWHDQRDSVICLELASGRELSRASYACPRHGRLATGDQGLYAGPTSTPELDEATGRLYTLSCDGDLKCWETQPKLRLAWELNLYDRYQVGRRPRVGRSGQRDYGYTTSPLIFGDWVIVEVGAESGTLIAFSKSTGQEVWRSQATGPAGHAGGMAPMTIQGVPCLATMAFRGLLVCRLDPDHAGETAAEYEWITDFANGIASPAVAGNQVVITSAYNHHKICKLEVTLNGARKIWERPLCSKVCTPVIHDGSIYWAWQQLHCLDFATGETRWSGGKYGDPGSCIATADGRLIACGGRGDLALVEGARRSPAQYHELATLERVLSTDAWPHVTLTAGRLLCKDRSGNLVCFTTAAADSNR